jgi:TRAP-type uncharacterized transport system substrate-binding protein
MNAGPAIGRRLPILLAAILAIAAIAVAIVLINPLPPRHVRMATGPEGGTYALVAKRYQEILARHGVRLELVPTNGSVDNVARLRDKRSGVSVALVQGGVTSAQESPDLLSLGTVFYEPVWIFVHGPAPKAAARLAAGTRICLGMPGSGTRKLVGELADAVGAGVEQADVRDLEPEQAAAALQKGDLDLAAFVMGWEAPVVRRLLADPSITLVAWARADAHLALRPYLERVRVPRGVADLLHDLPPDDVALVAPKASIVVRDDLNPGIQYLLLEAATETHGGPGIFNHAGVFPAAEPGDLPLSDHARQFYRSGPPILQRYLPFWLAVFAARMLLLLIPVVGVVYPLVRLVPAGYFWIMRRRIYRLYGELKRIDAERALNDPASPTPALGARIDALEQRANGLRVPASLTGMLFSLRDHIAIVRRQLK